MGRYTTPGCRSDVLPSELFPTVEIMRTTGDSYAAIVAQRVTTERLTLAEQWLERLRELLTVEQNDVFSVGPAARPHPAAHCERRRLPARAG
jgi:hypothetical protein